MKKTKQTNRRAKGKSKTTAVKGKATASERFYGPCKDCQGTITELVDSFQVVGIDKGVA